MQLATVRVSTSAGQCLLTRLAIMYERRRVQGENADDMLLQAPTSAIIMDPGYSACRMLIVIFQVVSKSTFSWCEYVELPHAVEGTL